MRYALCGQTISELADQLGKDLILEDLVIEKLGKQKNVTCVSCKKAASKLCLDCGETYCNSCSSAHKGMSMSKDHMQQDLPNFLLKSPQAMRSPTRTRSDSIMSATSQDGMKHSLSHDTPKQNADKDFLRMEARLCEEGVVQLKDASTAVEANILQLQEVKKRLDRQQQLLATYVTRLTKPDDALLANARAMLPRLKCVRADCRPSQEAALATLTCQVNGLLLQLLSRATSGGISFHPMECVPRKVFVTRPDTEGDTHKDGPGISSVVATHDGRLVMTDYLNNMVKVAELTSPANTVQGVQLHAAPHKLALLRDGLVAVTSDKKFIYFVDVSGNPTVVSHVQTGKRYWGVASIVEDDTLIVSSMKNKDNPASVDVISRAGVVLRNVVDSNEILTLVSPEYLCVFGGKVYISDSTASAVFRVELDSGRVLEKLTHSDLKTPQQVATDSDGNCYIACYDSQCVLVVTPGGQWRRLLYGPDHGDSTRICPRGLCVTSWGVIVTWYEKDKVSVVAAYDLT
nr:hypothetical protein BaRGS_004694 [Batillaria attramentaria]